MSQCLYNDAIAFFNLKNYVMGLHCDMSSYDHYGNSGQLFWIEKLFNFYVLSMYWLIINSKLLNQFVITYYLVTLWNSSLFKN
jgi:hypothetical protein